MSDPLACLDLAPDERVLWHGQPGVTLGKPDRQAARSFAIAGFLVVVLLFHQTPWTYRLPFGLVVGLLTGSGVALSRLVGGCQLSIGWLLTAGPLFALIWGLAVAYRGVGAGLELLAHPFPVLVAGLLVAAGIRVTRALLSQLHTHYYITSQRVAEVLARGEGGKVRWAMALPKGFLQFRVVRPWGARGRGHIALGTGLHRRLLMWLQAPEATLEDIKRSVDGFQSAPARPARAADLPAPAAAGDAPTEPRAGDAPVEPGPGDEPAAGEEPAERDEPVAASSGERRPGQDPTPEAG